MRSWQLFLCVACLCVLADLGIRPIGDCAEYALAGRAFVTRGTPALTAPDVVWLVEREPRLKNDFLPLADGIERFVPAPSASIRRAPSGAYYSLHFWLYSLLAAPFLGLTELFSASPIHALAAVNGLAASAAVWALWAHFGRAWFAVAVAALYVLSGTTFYLGWTGPEVLTSAGVVLACLAARRRKLELGLLATAVAAAQNPSAILLAAYVAYWCRPLGLPRGRGRWVVLGAAGVLSLLPYAFFYAAFRIPSLIARVATDFSLMDAERAFSLVFDLNEGLIGGVPGLLLATLLVMALALRAAAPSERRPIALDAATTLLVVTAMAVPTFAVHNWNSASSVLIRYGYWLVMPLVVLVGELARRVSPRPRWALFGCAALLQLALLAAHGVWGERSSYVRHSWAAKLVLRHFPGAYNPVPEIFYERSLGWEYPADKEDVVVWPYRGKPGKVMVRAGVVPRSPRICADDREIRSASVHAASDGWTYLDAPFTCAEGE